MGLPDYKQLNKKNGGCGKTIGIILLGIVGTFVFLLVLPREQKNDDRSDNVVVLASRTPAGEPSETPIPLPTNTPDMLTALNSVEPEREIVQAEVFEVSQRMQIVFMMEQDLPGAEAYMLKVVCAIRGYLPAGYGIRFAGDRGDGIELMTAIVDAPQIQALSCPATVDFASIAIEYDFVEGLTVTTSSQRIDELFLQVAGVVSVELASERDMGQQIGAVALLTIGEDYSLEGTRDLIWDAWVAHAREVYPADRRLVLDLTINQGGVESIWQNTSNSTDWLRLR